MRNSITIGGVKYTASLKKRKFDLFPSREQLKKEFFENLRQLINGNKLKDKKKKKSS